MMSFLLSALTFALITAALWLVGRWLFALRPVQDGQDPFRPRRMFGALNRTLAALLPITARAQTVFDRELRQAGYYQAFARENYLATRNTLLLLWTVLVTFTLFAAYDARRDPTVAVLAVGVTVAVAVFGVPRLALQSLAHRRVQRIQMGLPDGLDMLNMCVAGGLSLGTAFARVSREIQTSHTDVAFEFDIIRRHAEAYTMDHAMSLFAERLDVPDVKALTAVVTQAERLGTNVGTALQEYADSMRQTQRQRAEEQGNRRSVQMMFPIVLCLAPAVYILLVGPAILELREFLVRENQPGGALSQQAAPFSAMTAPPSPGTPGTAPGGAAVAP
jgi:tight adherence protein C